MARIALHIIAIMVIYREVNRGQVFRFYCNRRSPVSDIIIARHMELAITANLYEQWHGSGHPLESFVHLFRWGGPEQPAQELESDIINKFNGLRRLLSDQAGTLSVFVIETKEISNFKLGTLLALVVGPCDAMPVYPFPFSRHSGHPRDPLEAEAGHRIGFVTERAIPIRIGIMGTVPVRGIKRCLREEPAADLAAVGFLHGKITSPFSSRYSIPSTG